MNKYIIAALLLLPTYAVSSQKLALNNYEEIIETHNNQVTTTVKFSGKTDQDGYIYSPVYKNVSIEQISNYSVVPRLEKINGLDVYGWYVNKPNEQTILGFSFTRPEGDYTKKTKLKHSHPSGVKSFNYNFVNSAPMTIEKYQLTYKVPHQRELYKVMTPAFSTKKASYTLNEAGPEQEITITKRNISLNQAIKAEIALYESTAFSKLVVCGLLLMLALFFALKRMNIVVSKEYTQ
ncbi:hypothetical protein [Vibrio sp. 1S139]|uniref:hypothetical protein n=1 Tax=Vibrio sp. 1S139 TaxID=3230006 RepID=UPI00352D4576